MRMSPSMRQPSTRSFIRFRLRRNVDLPQPLGPISAVPDMYREGSFGLGAGKLRTVFSVVLPSAMPGILSGVILAIGRIVGETAALMYTSGTVAKVAGLMDSGTTLALHMYKQASEGLYLNEAYATSVVLLALVLLINLLSAKAAKLMVKGRG